MSMLGIDPNQVYFVSVISMAAQGRWEEVFDYLSNHPESLPLCATARAFLPFPPLTIIDFAVLSHNPLVIHHLKAVLGQFPQYNFTLTCQNDNIIRAVVTNTSLAYLELLLANNHIAMSHIFANKESLFSLIQTHFGRESPSFGANVAYRCHRLYGEVNSPIIFSKAIGSDRSNSNHGGSNQASPVNTPLISPMTQTQSIGTLLDSQPTTPVATPHTTTVITPLLESNWDWDSSSSSGSDSKDSESSEDISLKYDPSLPLNTAESLEKACPNSYPILKRLLKLK